MNGEYISKQKVLDYLNGYLHSLDGGGSDTLFDRGQRRALINSIQDILAVKAADVHPVKHAYWLGVGKKFSEDWTCSNCMRAKGKDSSINFCSYCGADMRGGTNAKVDT